MRDRIISVMLCCLSLVIIAAPQALAQDLPQECQDAMETRSPQAQVELFTRCLETGRLAAESKATTYKQRAIAYMHLGRHQRAIDDINQSLKLKPGDPDNYYLRGFAYRALNQHQQAVEDLDKAIAMEPNFAGSYSARAFAHKALGNTTQAKSDARRALEMDPRIKVPTF
jgi:tetratricopeptide (TPR) repeat protein